MKVDVIDDGQSLREMLVEGVFEWRLRKWKELVEQHEEEEKEEERHVNAQHFDVSEMDPSGLNEEGRRMAKSWFDMDFTLYNSQLARTQHSCSCFSGDQLPGACAHVATFLILLWTMCCDQDFIKKKLKRSARNTKIARNVGNVSGYSNKKKKAKKRPKNPRCQCNISRRKEKIKYCNCGR